MNLVWVHAGFREDLYQNPHRITAMDLKHTIVAVTGTEHFHEPENDGRRSGLIDVSYHVIDNGFKRFTIDDVDWITLFIYPFLPRLYFRLRSTFTVTFLVSERRVTLGYRP